MKKNPNPFVKVLERTWEKFKTVYTEYATERFDSIVKAVVNCKNPDLGYVEYRCMSCGKGFHKVGFSCKQKFCVNCSRKNSMEFIEEMMAKLHPGVVYRHLILTIPEQLRDMFYANKDSKELYGEFLNLGRNYIEDVFRKVTRIKDLKIGCVVVLHTAGRPGEFNPHLHIIVMNGGIDPSTGRWINLPYFKYENFLPKKWQWHLLNMVKRFDSSPETIALVKKLWKSYRKGFVNKFQKGDVPKKMSHLIKYLSKYISRPSISVSSVIKCDEENENITYSYKDHRTGRKVITTVTFVEFIKRIAQQILPKCFHRIRYYGLQHPSSFHSKINEINAGLKKIGKSSDMRDTFMAFAIGEWKWDRDVKVCEYCKSELELAKVWSKKYGVIYDIFIELMKYGIPPPKEEFQEESIKLEELQLNHWQQLSFAFEGGQALTP